MMQPRPSLDSLRQASGIAPATDMAVVRILFEEYAKGLGFSLCFQNFDEELAGLPGRYGVPGGGLWLAWVNGLPAGCVGLRPLEDRVCEMKRLYVRPDHAGHGLGRGLAEAALAGARKRGYRVMRLDTLKSMTAANALYRKLGFEQIGPYCDNPFEDARYYELTL
ncbi:MAG TPA: GNAT family N-acetyltransferase [Solidesulfovibrio magneticus]|nr:GNAT family N-acetyltransferase [Solidesulfovibrio magneticus]